jgi:hypothetical protein
MLNNPELPVARQVRYGVHGTSTGHICICAGVVA